MFLFVSSFFFFFFFFLLMEKKNQRVNNINHRVLNGGDATNRSGNLIITLFMCVRIPKESISLFVFVFVFAIFPDVLKESLLLWLLITDNSDSIKCNTNRRVCVCVCVWWRDGKRWEEGPNEGVGGRAFHSFNIKSLIHSNPCFFPSF